MDLIIASFSFLLKMFVLDFRIPLKANLNGLRNIFSNVGLNSTVHCSLKTASLFTSDCFKTLINKVISSCVKDNCLIRWMLFYSNIMSDCFESKKTYEQKSLSYYSVSSTVRTS